MTDRDYNDITLVVEGLEELMAVCEVGDDPYSITVTALCQGEPVSDVLVEMRIDERASKEKRATIIEKIDPVYDFGHLSLSTHVLQTDHKGKAHFKLRLEQPGEVMVKFVFHHISSDKDKEHEKEFPITVEKLDPAARGGGHTKMHFGQFGFNKPADHRFACEIETPESLTVGASATVRVKIMEQGKPVENASVSLFVQSLNIEVLMLSDLSAPMRSNTGSTDKNGFAVFRLTHQAKRAEEVTFRVLWQVDATKGEKDRIIKFIEMEKEEKKMTDKDKTKKTGTESKGGKNLLAPFMIVLAAVVVVAAVIGVEQNSERGLIGSIKHFFAPEWAEPEILASAIKAAPAKPVKKASTKSEAPTDNALASLIDDPWAEDADQSIIPENEDEQDDIVIKPESSDDVQEAEDAAEASAPTDMIFLADQDAFDVAIVSPKLSADLKERDELALEVKNLAQAKAELEQKNAALAKENKEANQKLEKPIYTLPSKIDCRGSTGYSRERGNVIVFHDCTAWVEKKVQKRKKPAVTEKPANQAKPKGKVKKPKPKAANDDMGADAYDKSYEKKKQKLKQNLKAFDDKV